MAAMTAHGVEGVRAIPLGEVLGESEPVEVTQREVDLFAEATGDHQWVHVDVERAAASPFGSTIAHGYYTLSLIPRVLPQVLELTGFSLVLNYGCEKVRFPAPVPVGSVLRARVVLDAVADVPGGLQLTLTVTFTADGSPKPACVATILTRQLL